MHDSHENLLTTPLNALHKELGAKMVPFAGYEMPVQYTKGIIAEHNHCREKASLFDVSHMGQGKLIGANAAEALETLVPGSYKELKVGKQRYTVLTNDKGGIIDDLMVANAGDHIAFVVNASRKAIDFARMREKIGHLVEVVEITDRALLALQGPMAGEVMKRLAPESASMVFMDVKNLKVGGFDCFVSRSGYTGEDGFEISVKTTEAEALARKFLAEPEVEPCGLGARDTLRLEAGLCLYGNDIDETTTPVEGSIEFAIGKRRREEGGFPGAEVILHQLKNGTSKKLVALRPIGKMPARAHTKIHAEDGSEIGEITSGGFAPTVAAPIAIGYVKAAYSAVGSKLKLKVRETFIDAEVVALPFVAHRYYRG